MSSTGEVVIVVGYAPAWRQAAGKHHRDGTTIFVEEPSAAVRLGTAQDLKAARSPCRLVEFGYQHDGAAARFHEEFRNLAPVAVVPGVEYAVPFAAELAELFGVPGAGVGAARSLRDKWLLRQALAGGPVANPLSRPVSGPAEIRAMMAECQTPVILKPANRQGAVGTQILRDPADAEGAWTACVEEDQLADAPQDALPVRMLVEQFIEGLEYSVELLLREGETLFANLTQKYLYAGARPVEQGRFVPADVTATLRDRLVSETELVLRTVGFRTGFVHCEWIVRAGTPYLVECAGRIPGDWIIGLIDLAWGIDITGDYLAVMSGATPRRPLPAEPFGGSAIWFMSAPPGTVTAIGDVPAARAAPGVLSVEILVSPGDVTRAPRCGRDRTGFVVAAGLTGRDALRLAQRATDMVDFQVA